MSSTVAKERISLQDFLDRTSGGQVFTVEFFKRSTGDLRKMNCRRGVKKGVKGVGMAYDPSAKNLLVVFDMQKLEEGATEKGAFRMINLSDLHSLKLKGKVYNWSHVNQVFVEQ